jgi:hypothetical protein
MVLAPQPPVHPMLIDSYANVDIEGTVLTFFMFSASLARSASTMGGHDHADHDHWHAFRGRGYFLTTISSSGRKVRITLASDVDVIVGEMISPKPSSSNQTHTAPGFAVPAPSSTQAA